MKTHATFGSQQKNISLGKVSTKKGLVENILHVIQNDLLIPQLEVMIRPLKGSRKLTIPKRSLSQNCQAENFRFTSSNPLGKKEIKIGALGGSSQLLVSGSDHPHLQAIYIGHLEGGPAS